MSRSASDQRLVREQANELRDGAGSAENNGPRKARLYVNDGGRSLGTGVAVALRPSNGKKLDAVALAQFLDLAQEKLRLPKAARRLFAFKDTSLDSCVELAGSLNAEGVDWSGGVEILIAVSTGKNHPFLLSSVCPEILIAVSTGEEWRPREAAAAAAAARARSNKSSSSSSSSNKSSSSGSSSRASASAVIPCLPVPPPHCFRPP